MALNGLRNRTTSPDKPWLTPVPKPAATTSSRADSTACSLRSHADTCEEAAKCADYIDKDRTRMRYPEFRAKDLCGLRRRRS